MSQVRRLRGTAARHSGRRADILAALWLIAKGYRILGFRMPTPQGEIDLLVGRGDVLAAVEVKQRKTIESTLEAVGFKQRQRLRRALFAFATRRGRKDARIRLDLMALAPARFPRHIPGAWSEDGDQS